MNALLLAAALVAGPHVHAINDNCGRLRAVVIFTESQFDIYTSANMLSPDVHEYVLEQARAARERDEFHVTTLETGNCQKL